MLVDDIPLDDDYRSIYMMLIHKYIFEFFIEFFSLLLKWRFKTAWIMHIFFQSAALIHDFHV